MAYSPHLSLPYREFIQSTRAFRPSELIPEISRISALLGEPPFPNKVSHRLPPWGMAAAARESLLHGNEHRKKPVDGNALLKLMADFQISMDVNNAEIGTPGFSTKLLTQIMYEQAPYLESAFEELARSHAWLVEGLPNVETKVLSDIAIREILGGASLREAIGATFLLHVGALQNGGTFDPRWLNQKNFEDVLAIYPRATIMGMLTRLTTTPKQFRESYNSTNTHKSGRFAYNPLVATPFVDLGDGVPVAPATRLILRTVSPSGLYYSGVAKFGNDFANDLGKLFEHYIGRQLSLIGSAEVVAEIPFGKGAGQRSVDWFVILPKLVILVEVKSARLTASARAGEPGLSDSLDRTLGRAIKQLIKTVGYLEDQRDEFHHIPTDRKFLAIIVTAEPFYTAPTYLMERDKAAIPSDLLHTVPIAVASARDIESLVAHGNDVESILLDRIDAANQNGSTVNLRNDATSGSPTNPILENAWESYPWPSSTTSNPLQSNQP